MLPILALAASLAAVGRTQPIPLFYRTDYPLAYSQLGEEGPLIIADLNNDGKLDVVMGGGLGIAVALGKGDGSFQPLVTFVPEGGMLNGTWILSSVVMDFDGDGNLDLALESGLGSGAGIVILPGKGDGTFGSGYPIASKGFLPPVPNVKLLDAADFNQDGRPDIVLLTENNGSPPIASVTVFLNDGNGAFHSQLAFNLPSSEYAVGVTVADLNHDGVPDLAVIGQVLGGFGPPPAIAGHLYVALGRGDGSFASPTTVAASLNQVPNFIAVADFNHDGIPDLAINTGTTIILLGDGNGTFRSAQTVNLGHVNPGWIEVGDWTGSGTPGLGIFTDVTPAGIGLVQGNGNGTFYSAGTAALDILGGDASAYASADFNGDGLPDLVVASGGNIVSVFLNAGASPPLSFVPQSAADDITTVAPGSLATIYGEFPFSAAQPSTNSLPSELGDVSVNVLDSAGIAQSAPLAYVGPSQINLEIPPGIAPGVAMLIIQTSGASWAGSALVRGVVPAIFTEQDIAFQGEHYPAAYAITYGPDGQPQPPILVAACQTMPAANCNAVPIPRPAGSRVFLELFVTGIRNHVSPVVASLNYGAAGPGGQAPLNVAPTYAGPQGQFDGVDQVNVEITNLATLPLPQGGPSGTLYTLVLNVDGFVSNPVSFAVQ